MLATAAVGVFQVCASTGHTLAEGSERAGYFTFIRCAIGVCDDFSLAVFGLFYTVDAACFRGISPSRPACQAHRHGVLAGRGYSPVAMSTGSASIDRPQHTAIDAPWRPERAWEHP